MPSLFDNNTELKEENFNQLVRGVGSKKGITIWYGMITYDGGFGLSSLVHDVGIVAGDLSWNNTTGFLKIDVSDFGSSEPIIIMNRDRSSAFGGFLQADYSTADTIQIYMFAEDGTQYTTSDSNWNSRLVIIGV